MYAYKLLFLREPFFYMFFWKCWTFIKICFELWLHKFFIILLVPGTLVHVSASNKVESSFLYLEVPYSAFMLHGAHVLLILCINTDHLKQSNDVFIIYNW